MLQNHNTIVNALTQFANNNLSLRRFKVSFFEQFDNFSTSGDSFPILYAIPNEVSFEENIDVQSFRVYCVDILQKDRSNEQYILNDSLLVLRDLTNWLRQGDNGLNILNIPRAIPVNNFLVDFTCGWYIDIDIECEAITTDCAIPFSSNFVLTGTTCDIAYVTDFLTCETLIECQGYIDLGNEIINIYTILSGLTGQTTYQYWTSGSTGTHSIKANNNSGLDATGDYAVAIGNATTAMTQSSFAAGFNSIANAPVSSIVINTNVLSGITMTNNDPNNNSYAVVFPNDVTLEWGDYFYNFCSTFTLYNSTGASADFSFDCTNIYGIYYDISTNSTYIVDGGFIDDTYTSISGNTNSTVSFTYPSFAMGTNVQALGSNSFATGLDSIASGVNSHAEGNLTTASGLNSHSEGNLTTASGNYSHAEGVGTKASTHASHAEGEGTTSNGFQASHAEGYATKASGNYGSHSEGSFTIASGISSHAEGGVTTAIGYASHAEGFTTTALGSYSHSEGYLTIASGISSHAGGYASIASGQTSFVHGSLSQANGSNTIVLGANIIGNNANTTYVDHLNIKTVPTGTSVNNLGIDSNGNVIIGSTATTSYDTYVTGGTYSNGTTTFTNSTGGTFSVTGLTINKFSYTDSSNGITSVSNSNTLSKSVLIPANTLTNGSLNIKGRSHKSGTGSFAWLIIYVNTTNSLSGASEIGRINNASNNTVLRFSIDRTIPIKVGSFFSLIINAIYGYEETITNNVSTVTIDWTVDQYIILAVQANGGASPSESLVANFLSVNQF